MQLCNPTLISCMVETLCTAAMRVESKDLVRFCGSDMTCTGLACSGNRYGLLPGIRGVQNALETDKTFKFYDPPIKTS